MRSYFLLSSHKSGRIKSLKKKLTDWIDSHPFKGNEWLRFHRGRLSVYVRRNRRYVKENKIDCFDIATVEVSREFRGQGLFRRFLIAFEEAAKARGLAVFVENVLTPMFAEFFRNKGYSQIPNSEIVTCFIKTNP